MNILDENVADEQRDRMGLVLRITPSELTVWRLHALQEVAVPADGTFRPYSKTTRAQQVKLVVLGFARPLTTPVGGQYTFADVPRAFPFFAVIETATAQGIASGYTCGGPGGPGEPCDAQRRPYFRPATSATRGQIAKIVYGAITSGGTCAR